MKEKIKNFFLVFKSFLQKKLISACPVAKRSLWFGALLLFTIFGLILPVKSVHALDIFGAIVGAIMSIILKIIGILFLLFPLFISAAFLSLMSLILGWIISPDFISLKFTQNPFVDVGLSITQGFANMFFIIILVAIGLATALRIEEYKAKKTLPILILIALLINFSPVFCGFIIDASNIVMNFFLSNIIGLEGLKNAFVTTSQGIWQMLFGSGFDLWANIAAIMQVLVMMVFNFFAGFIYILFSALFIMRYIMLWILVILSPIAFVSYILPVTRRGGSLLSWRTWWEQLIAWSIIGIIAGFFLYLGFTMISMVASDPRAFTCQPGDPDCGAGLGLMNNVLPYLIPLVLLWIAYRETKRTSAMFAKEIVEMPEKMAKAAVTAAAIFATKGLAMGAIRGIPGATATEARIRERLERAPLIGRMMGGPGAYAESQKKETAKARAKIEGRDTDALHDVVKRRPLTTEDRHTRAAAMQLLGERKKFKDEEKQYVKEAQLYGADMKPISQAMPKWAPEIMTKDAAGRPTRMTIREVVEKQDPGEFRRNLQAASLKGTTPQEKERAREVLISMDIRKLIEIERRGSTEQKDVIRELIQTQRQELGAMVRTLRAAGRLVEADRAERTLIAARRSPTFNP